jgi:hypothetical protein
MAIIFLDSFDHYDTAQLSQKWSTAATALIDTSGTRSRTGPGCILCFPFGPELNFTPGPSYVMGIAYSAEAFTNNDCMGLISGTGVFRNRQVRANVQTDGSIQILAGNDPFHTVLGQTAPNLLQANVYAYVEMKVSAFSLTGTVTLRVNGQVVLVVTGNTDSDGSGTAQTFYIGGPGTGPTAAIDDLYLCNLINSGIPGQPNYDVLGAIRIYTQVPTANASPLQWTPLAGTNFSEVNQIPPPGDASYVQDGNVGDVDQYVYGTAGIIPPVQIFGVQHILDGKLDVSGSRSIASDVSGVVAAGQALSTSYNMVKTPYDGNPVSGAAWQLTDFATVRFGPKVTA